MISSIIIVIFKTIPVYFPTFYLFLLVLGEFHLYLFVNCFVFGHIDFASNGFFWVLVTRGIVANKLRDNEDWF